MRSNRKKAAVLAALSSLAIAWLQMDALGEEGQEFFSLSLSRIGDGPLLENEVPWFVIRVTNPHEEELSYMPPMTREFISGVTVELFHAGDRMKNVRPLNFSYRAFWAGPRVRALQPGDTLESLWSPYSSYELPEGNYKAVARLRQSRSSFGLATGEAVSNAVEFAVRGWRAAVTREREVKESLTPVKLIKTADGEFLVEWSDLKCPLVMPLGKDLPLDDLLWAADDRACVVVVPDSGGVKRRVIVAHALSPFVESYALGEGLDEDGDVSVSVLLRKSRTVPEPEEPSQEETPEERGTVGRGWPLSALGLACSAALGAALGGVAAWLVMRRKRRAS